MRKADSFKEGQGAIRFSGPGMAYKQLTPKLPPSLFKSLGASEIERLFADQAHPNAEGHQLIAKTLLDHVKGEAGIR